MTLLSSEVPVKQYQLPLSDRLALFEDRQGQLDILYQLTGELIVNEYLDPNNCLIAV